MSTILHLVNWLMLSNVYGIRYTDSITQFEQNFKQLLKTTRGGFVAFGCISTPDRELRSFINHVDTIHDLRSLIRGNPISVYIHNKRLYIDVFSACGEFISMELRQITNRGFDRVMIPLTQDFRGLMNNKSYTRSGIRNIHDLNILISV